MNPGAVFFKDQQNRPLARLIKKREESRIWNKCDLVLEKLKEMDKFLETYTSEVKTRKKLNPWIDQ